jgi:hypothetical protein
MPTASLSTLATGARQLVVQEALETTVCALVSLSWLMRRGFVLRGEEPGAFQRDVYAEVFPRQLRRVLERGDLDRAVAATDGVALDRDLAGEAAVHGIEAEQMRVGFDRREVVDRDDFDIVTFGFHRGTQDIAADPAKAVDGDAHRHFPVSLATCSNARPRLLLM